MKNKESFIKSKLAGPAVKNFLFDNKVLLLFVVLCVACIAIAEAPLTYVGPEVFTRFGRNACIILSLIIPCLAGLGMNFGIVVGAIAAQLSIIAVVHWGFTGIGGFLLCGLISTPVAIFFGWLLGLLYNKTKGAEMIAGLVLGFFADGVYRLIVLYIIGGVIPYDDPNLLPRGFGLRNAIDLSGNIKYSLDDISFLTVFRLLMIVLVVAQIVGLIYKKCKKLELKGKAFAIKIIAAVVGFAASFAVPYISFLNDMLGGTRLLLIDAMLIGSVVFAVWTLIKRFVLKKYMSTKRLITTLVVCAVIFGITFIPDFAKIFKASQISACTYGVICLFCLFNNWILETKLGQDMRTVGQNRIVARSAGINVNRIRIIATCISTVLAAWGQLIYLQNLGTFNTVQQQSNVGLYAVAAILVGGASVKQATNKQALIGVVLFHTLFVVTPLAATKIFGDSAVSEYIRMFFSYGVIAVSLAMHAWKKAAKKKVEKASDKEADNSDASVQDVSETTAEAEA